jgi:hypothetical protein
VSEKPIVCGRCGSVVGNPQSAVQHAHTLAAHSLFVADGAKNGVQIIRELLIARGAFTLTEFTDAVSAFYETHDQRGQALDGSPRWGQDVVEPEKNDRGINVRNLMTAAVDAWHHDYTMCPHVGESPIRRVECTECLVDRIMASVQKWAGLPQKETPSP